MKLQLSVLVLEIFGNIVMKSFIFDVGHLNKIPVLQKLKRSLKVKID